MKDQTPDKQPRPEAIGTLGGAIGLFLAGFVLLGVVAGALLVLPSLVVGERNSVSPTGGEVRTQPVSPRVGYPAPDFSLTTLEGKTVSLSGLRGKPVMVYFWAFT